MEKKSYLFNRIAKTYGLFFNWQVRKYRRILNSVRDEFDFSAYQTIIDIGCGTGALCKVLQENGIQATGIDSAEAILVVAQKKAREIEPGEPGIQFIFGDLLNGLPFGDKSFDIAVTSYVAHGLMPNDRATLYNEMKRVAKHSVVLLDYNQRRSPVIDIAERREGGDYFNYICIINDELMQQFGNLKVINTGKHSAMYICNV